MNVTDLKIYVLSSITMALNFSTIEVGLKAVLTLVVICYTCQKWYLMNRDKNKKK
jgi:uncharacterized membrane protein YbaN (DUF454 family)